MHVTIVRELIYVLTVNLQLLTPNRIPGSVTCSDGLWCLRASRSERIEEFVFALRGMCTECRTWSCIFFLEVIPLRAALARHKVAGACMMYLYTRVLGPEVYGAMMC